MNQGVNHLYARTVMIHLKSNSVREFTQMFEKDILPLLQRRDGFTNEITFLVEDGQDTVAIKIAAQA
jgi:hypothetical protein